MLVTMSPTTTLPFPLTRGDDGTAGFGPVPASSTKVGGGATSKLLTSGATPGLQPMIGSCSSAGLPSTIASADASGTPDPPEPALPESLPNDASGGSIVLPPAPPFADPPVPWAGPPP